MLLDLYKKLYTRKRIRAHIVPDILSVNEHIRMNNTVNVSDTVKYELYREFLAERDMVIKEREKFISDIGMLGHGNKSRIESTLYLCWNFIWLLKYAAAFGEPSILKKYTTK